MPRNTEVITISLPPEMAEQVRQLMKAEDRTMSGLIREALPLYMQEAEWRRIQRYGQRRAREQGIAPEDAERLVDDYRAEGPQEEQGGRTPEPEHRLHARSPLRQGLQRPPGRGPVHLRPASGAQRLCTEERLHRRPRVHRRGRERSHRRPPRVPQDDRRGRQAQRRFPGDSHPADTIATENSGIRGRSIWVHSS